MNEQQYKELIAKQYKMCVKDPIHFITNYCYVQHTLKGRILFDLYEFQKSALGSILEPDRTIILKGRQLGLSTLIAAYALWMMLFHPDKRVLVIATQERVAKKLVEKVVYMYDFLPSWLQTKLKEKSQKQKMVFVNNSQIEAIAATKNAGRGDALSLLVIDEMAFIPNAIMDEIWKAATKTLATGGQGIFLSTPNGKSNKFYKVWNDAEQGINGFNFMKLPWFVHPDRDQAWRDNEDIELGIDDASQENDCLGGNSMITIYDKYTDKIKQITLEDLYNEC